MRMATLRQFAYFLAVVEEGSFSRAAARMHVAQPSLSQQVRALEAELGGPLLDRLPRAVRLTPAGRAVLPHAELAVRSAERARGAAHAALDVDAGELEISTISSLAAGLLPDLIRRWRTRHPDSTIHLKESSHRRTAEETVRERICEIGIGPRPQGWSGPIESLGWEEFVVVLPEADPLVGRPQLKLADLAERRWVLFEPEHGLSEVVARACDLADPPFVPTAAVFTSQVDAAARLAAAGVGPALVPSTSVPDDLAGAAVSIRPRVGRELTVYGRVPWSGLAAAFIELLGEMTWPAAPRNAMDVG
jgi:DNA-binding transcriptional LysR family regulator